MHAAKAAPGSPATRIGADPDRAVVRAGLAPALAVQLAPDARARIPEAARRDAGEGKLDAVGVAP